MRATLYLESENSIVNAYRKCTKNNKKKERKNTNTKNKNTLHESSNLIAMSNLAIMDRKIRETMKCTEVHNGSRSQLTRPIMGADCGLVEGSQIRSDQVDFVQALQLSRLKAQGSRCAEGYQIIR